MSMRGRVAGVLAANPRAARWRAGHGLAVIVGQAPTLREHAATAPGSPGVPLTGDDGRTLAKLAGLRFPEEFVATFDRVNLFTSWCGTGPNGDAFPLEAAQVEAGRLLPALAGYPVVLLGWNVARAFGMSPDPPLDIAFFDWLSYRFAVRGKVLEAQIASLPTDHEIMTGWPDFGSFPHWPNDAGFPVAVVPHPSGLRRRLKASGEVATAAMWWRELVRRLRECAPPG